MRINGFGGEINDIPTSSHYISNEFHDTFSVCTAVCGIKCEYSTNMPNF
jgi:hypothetical protein